MTPIEINPIPVQIGYVWFYEKMNCHTWERYISVESYEERYGNGEKKYFTKSVYVSNSKTKETIKFNSFKAAGEYAKVSRETIWKTLNHPYNKTVRKIYTFSLTEFVAAVYTNRNFN